MPQHSHKIGLVVDRAYGDRLLELARTRHVWVVESPINTPIVRGYWNSSDAQTPLDPEGPGITSFDAEECESPEETCTRIADDIDTHHGEYAHVPPWSDIAVIGVPLTEHLRHVFSGLGAVSFKALPNGFICTRGESLMAS